MPRIAIAAAIKRMQALEAPRLRAHQRPGVMLVPPIEYDLEKWEAQALASQAELMHATREGLELPYASTGQTRTTK